MESKKIESIIDKGRSKVKTVSILLVGLLLGTGIVGLARANEGELLKDVKAEAARLVCKVITLTECNNQEPELANLGAFDASPTTLTDLEVTNDLLVHDVMAMRDDNDSSSSTVETWYDVKYLDVASSTYFSRQNTQTGDVLVRLIGIFLDGNASATTKFSMGTSTVALAPDFNTAVANLPRGILDQTTVATGTINAIVGLQEFSGNTGDALSASSTFVRVPNGSYVVGFYTTGGSNAIHGSSATSTAGRGFSSNSYVLMQYLRIATGTYALRE